MAQVCTALEIKHWADQEAIMWEVGECTAPHIISVDRAHTQRFEVIRHLLYLEWFLLLMKCSWAINSFLCQYFDIVYYNWGQRALLSSESSWCLYDKWEVGWGKWLQENMLSKSCSHSHLGNTAVHRQHCSVQAPLLRRAAALPSPFSQLLPHNSRQYFLYILSVLMAVYCKGFMWKGIALPWQLEKQEGA